MGKSRNRYEPRESPKENVFRKASDKFRSYSRLREVFRSPLCMPRVHKEIENEDQAQNQIDKFPLLAQNLLKFVEICITYSGGQD